MREFTFTNNWFDTTAKGIWNEFLPQIKPEKILEIGSYEGASACYLIEKLACDAEIEIHCVDTWSGGIEHKEGGTAETDMRAVESRFNHNVNLAVELASKPVALVIHKGPSDLCLAKLISEGKTGYFDFIYVDGSHQAPDVLCDAVLAFRLLKTGGFMVFDDYLWSEGLPGGRDLLRCPKPAIDAFTNIYSRQLQILSAPLYQLYVQKVAE
jgi:predicted O-methyltransferase YrrM